MANTDPIPRHVAIMRIFVTLIVLVVALGILTAPNRMFSQHFDEGIQKFAVGWIGAIIGYWLA